MKTKKVTISLTAEQQQQAKTISKELIGRENISGLFAFWINQYLKSKPS
jgi:hypothetical protein